jgi:hypothetical protein
VLHLIVIEQKRIAVALADTLNYDRALPNWASLAGSLSRRLPPWSKALCIRIFETRSDGLGLTKEGDLLVRHFREALSRCRFSFTCRN